jgi:hypothetical protein
MDPFDPKRLSIKKGNGALAKPYPEEKPPRHKKGEKFLKGPVPLSWLASAAQLPGKSLHLGIVLWFLAGLKNTRSVSLSSSVLQRFGVDRSAKRRALSQLETAGLVSVHRHSGCNPLVTILSDQEKPQ